MTDTAENVLKKDPEPSGYDISSKYPAMTAEEKKLIDETPDYYYDLFIAYFYVKPNDTSDYAKDTTEDAKALYQAIEGDESKYHGKYKIFLYPITYKNYNFDVTPYLIAKKSKALLLVGKEPSRIVDLSETHKELGKEINAVWDNPFMRMLGREKNRAPGRLYAADGAFDMLCLSHPAWATGSEKAPNAYGNCPFSGGTEFLRKDGDPPADEVAEWLDGVIREFSKSDYCTPDIRIGKDELYLNEMNLYWVGTRQSDADQCGELFTGTVCLFGDDDQKTHFAYCAEIDGRIDHNVINEAADAWVYETVLRIAKKDPKARFYCYNQGIVFNTFDKDGKNPYLNKLPGTGESLLDRFICLNDKKVVNTYSSKEHFRRLCGTDKRIHTLPCVSVKKEACDFHSLTEHFSKTDTVTNKTRFVIQAPMGSGGETTFVLDSSVRSGLDLERKLNNSTTYTATIYQENNVPVNVHALIFKKRSEGEKPTIWLSPPSIQLICHTEQRLMYRGADFIECDVNDQTEPKNIDPAFLQEFLKQARAFCEALSEKGYVGVCGVDGILCDMNRPGAAEHPEEHVFLMELNARFQASTGLLNRALQMHGLPSMQHLNLYAFYSSPSRLPSTGARKLSDRGTSGENRTNVLDGGLLFANLQVPFANMSYIHCSTRLQAMHLLRCAERPAAFRKTNHIVDYELDALDAKRYLPLDEDASEEEKTSRASFVDRVDPNAYLYRIVFSTNLCWVNNASSLYFNENLLDEDRETHTYILSNHTLSPEERTERMLRTKVALLIQGVNFSEDAQKEFRRPGTFQSVDIVFKSKRYFDNYVVNAPVVNPINTDEVVHTNGYDEKSDPESDEKKEEMGDPGIKFTQLTPFLIDIDRSAEKKNKGKIPLALYYYGKRVDGIELMPEDKLWRVPAEQLWLAPEKQTEREEAERDLYQQIAYLSTDRLRVHLTNACKFKREKKGCRFCGISCGTQDCLAQDKATFTQENVEKVIDSYVKAYRGDKIRYFTGTDENGQEIRYFPLLRHFLVGGQTADLKDEDVAARLIRTVRTIYDLTGHVSEIYAMIVPCNSITVERMKDAGLTHLAFNMEIWDDDIAERIMPGKRKRSKSGELSGREAYLADLKIAREIMEEHESVRSMLLIGLEPPENTLEGIRALLDIDVQPMLSIFRPMPGTVFANAMSPQISDVVALYHKAAAMCEKKEYQNARGMRLHRTMHLGPDCKCCQNNTVALPYEEETKEEDD